MVSHTSPAGRPQAAARPASPGRPKDLGKRAAILEAAKQLFSDQGFNGASMDQIAAEAGVSKLTVYSHFGDKEALFTAAVRAKCDEMLPDDLFQTLVLAPHQALIRRARELGVTVPIIGFPRGSAALAENYARQAGCEGVALDTACPLEVGRRVQAIKPIQGALDPLLLPLDNPTSGQVLLGGQDLHALPPRALRAARRDFQMVFQDPYGSLDPRHTVERIVAEPLTALDAMSAADQRQRVQATLESVGLRPSDLGKYPHEFSGGQRQRIAIARALVTRPRLIVADEPVSALDVSVQAQVLNLMMDMQQQFGVTYLLISHDLAVVNHLCSDVAVMTQGRIVELAPAAQIFSAPQHPYTRLLLGAAMV